MRRHYLLTASLGILLSSCNSRDNGISLSVDSSKLAYSASLPHDFQNGTWGEGISLLDAYEHVHGIRTLDSIYVTDAQQTLIRFYEPSGFSDTYYFDKNGKLAAGLRLSTLYLINHAYQPYTSQMIPYFKDFVKGYQARYGKGVVNTDSLTATWITNRSTIKLSGKDLDVDLYIFQTSYLPKSSAEIALNEQKASFKD